MSLELNEMRVVGTRVMGRTGGSMTAPRGACARDILPAVPVVWRPEALHVSVGWKRPKARSSSLGNAAAGLGVGGCMATPGSLVSALSCWVWTCWPVLYLPSTLAVSPAVCGGNRCRFLSFYFPGECCVSRVFTGVAFGGNCLLDSPVHAGVEWSLLL